MHYFIQDEVKPDAAYYKKHADAIPKKSAASGGRTLSAVKGGKGSGKGGGGAKGKGKARKSNAQSRASAAACGPGG